MDDKEELLQTIDNYDIFTKAQRKILKALITMEIDSRSTISVKNLSKVADVSAASVYQTINLFVKDNILDTVPSSNKKMNTFIIKKSRIEEIRKIAIKTKEIIK